MPQEPPAKRARKGTKSCIECRHRKVRCVWPSEGAESCQRCMAKGRSCELQVYMTPASDAPRMNSRARIVHLESSVSNLWTVVRKLEAQLGCVPAEVDEAARLRSQSAGAHASHNQHPEDDDSDLDSESATSPNGSPANPPTHLLQLFDNDLLSSSGHGTSSLPQHVSSLHQAHDISELRRLMPSREDMLIITAHASSWLSLYNSLFPFQGVTKTSGEMLLQYDKVQDPRASPVAITSLLLSVALTVQQAPHDTTVSAVQSIRNASLFIKDVSDTVERIFVADDALVGNLEGLETALLFLRLQLGRAKVRKMWVLLRRVIALAELIGLPRASVAISQPGASPPLVKRHKQKAETWDSICAVDRIVSIMWSLPLATANCLHLKRPPTSPEGQVIPRAYLYNLADIASRILEQDNACSSGRSLTELFNAVIGTDQELRSLASLAPPNWWKISWSELSVDAVLQYWHQYLTVRTHLQLAIRYDEDQRFAFNFITCLDACQNMARRYVSLRALLPAGFFACHVLDLQVFTAAIFLLLASHRTARSLGISPQAVDVDFTTVDQVVQTMEAAGRAGGGFAHQAADAIRSLSSLLQQPHMSDSQKLTLSLPLVGKIHVSRKSSASMPAPTWSYPAPNSQPQPNLAPQTMHTSSSELDLMTSLSYSMELPEDYSFLTDEPFGIEQWLTWSGSAGNS